MSTKISLRLNVGEYFHPLKHPVGLPPSSKPIYLRVESVNRSGDIEALVPQTNLTVKFRPGQYLPVILTEYERYLA